MSDLLNTRIVLVLNRNWQAINIRSRAEAFRQMVTNVATALDIELRIVPPRKEPRSLRDTLAVER